MNLFTYLTVQVTRRDTFLQDELRKSLASLLADWGRAQALQHNGREIAQVPNLNSPDELQLMISKPWLPFNLRNKSKTNDQRFRCKTGGGTECKGESEITSLAFLLNWLSESRERTRVGY